MFVNEVSRKTGACMMLLIMDVLMFLCMLGVNFPKRLVQIGVPVLLVAEYFFLNGSEKSIGAIRSWRIC